jgi:superfamily II DNA/RNA helicase
MGGDAVAHDVKRLDSSVACVVVGTPGDVLDVINRRAEKAYGIFWNQLVLYDADEMLSRGFKDQMNDFLHLLGRHVNVRRTAPTRLFHLPNVPFSCLLLVCFSCTVSHHMMTVK